ncbi:helix-turn-helix domain-containing protein [Streptomyces sp. SID12501]|uniref:Transposase n=1 Tax=Streptomyces sp. SID12501 TaxID=2706042 RepID=A0A6B3BG88_9ACTN|nr:helix-turn-helix domain-containing protein [Streptomyces sp. SID12501]NEC84711.1 transposase [Streptomyces sp. SID12501]
MPRVPVLPAEEKARIVLNLLSGRTTLSQAALQAGVSAQSVSVWRRQFIEAGHTGFQPLAQRSEAARRERRLLGEIQGLKAALGEAHLALRATASHRAYSLR